MKVLIPLPVHDSNEFNHLPKGVHQYKLAYIISRLCKPLSFADKEEFYSTGCIPLSSKMLKKLMGDSYRAHLDYLIEFGLIFLCEEYEVGVSNRYTLNDEFLGELVPYEIRKTTYIKKANQRERDRADYARALHPYPCSYFDSRLEIDESAAMQYISELYDRDLADPNICSGKRSLRAQRKRMVRQSSVYNVRQKRWLLHTGKKCKRFYSVLTNMHKPLRQFLRYNGERLTEWDITNSQPLFSTLLLSPKFYEDNPFNLDEVCSSNEYIQKRVQGGPGTSPGGIMFPKIESYLSEPDVRLYLKQSIGGTIYEYIADKIFGSVSRENRNKAKKLIYQSLFCEVQYKYQDKKVEKFKNLFPSVYRVFVQFKKSDHSVLALILQNIEAKFILARCVNGLQVRFPDVPFFTIHDSFLLPESKHKQIRVLLDEELKSFIGDYHPDSNRVEMSKGVWGGVS